MSSKTPSKTSDWVVDGRRSLHYSGTFAGIFLTGYAPFFLALCLGYLFLSLRFDGKSNLLGGLKRHMLYHTTHQLFVKTAKEQNKPHKKALPIQRVIDFKLEDNYVISDGHYVYFYRYYAPNTHIMTDDEIQSEIGKLGRLFDTLKCSFSLFATDKVENLEAIKNYYLSLPVRYEYINSEIVESIERSDVESSAVQRAYYIIYRTDSPQEDIYSTLSGHGLHVERATKAETAVLLRNYFVREFLNCDIYTIAEEVSNIPNIKKAKQVVFDREILSRLTPHNIHFSASYAEQGNCYRKTLMIKNFPKDIPPAALMELAKQRGTTFTMRLTPMNRSIARRLINNQMRQQNVRRGKGMVTERIEADQDAAIIRDFYADINRNHNSIYHVNVFVEIYGSTRNELAEMEKKSSTFWPGFPPPASTCTWNSGKPFHLYSRSGQIISWLMRTICPALPRQRCSRFPVPPAWTPTGWCWAIRRMAGRLFTIF